MATPELTIARIYSEPELTGGVPRALRFSPDGKLVTSLRPSAEELTRLDLWAYRVDSGASELLVESAAFTRTEPLSDQEKANRERRRITATGIVEYLWSPTNPELLFPIDGTLYRYGIAEDEGVRQLTPDDLAITDATYARSGQWVSFVANQNLYIVSPGDATLRQLTFDGGGTVSNGIAEFIAQEEMHRYRGHWWSPDSKRIAFTRSDEAPIPVSQRYEIDADEFRVYDQRYPFAGEANARVQLGIVDIADGATRWLDLAADAEDYLARVTWLPDSHRLAVQLQTRDQRRLDLHLYDCETGQHSLLLSETATTWINLHQEPIFLEHSDEMVWVSERSGFRHLYLVDLATAATRPLTEGEWCVHKLLRVHEAERVFYFTAGIPTPIESHLYRGDLSQGAEIGTPLTRAPGFHEIELSADCRHFIDAYSTGELPPRVALHTIDGDRAAWLSENEPARSDHPYHAYLDAHRAPEFGVLEAEDGQALHYRLMLPSPCAAGTRYPVILLVYGGPGVRRVRNEWCSMWHQYLVRHGYGVMELDNRGSTDRGVAFEAPIHNRLGEIEVIDQLRGVEFLRALPWVDGERIGVYGHSYGGYMTLMLMAKGGGIFRAGVSVAPVTDWRLYDTHYTERYLSHPDENTKGYEESAVFPYLDGLRGELMLMHGMADDNVLFTHTTRLMKALQERNIKFTLMTYPGAKHSLAGRTVNIHRFETVAEFFERTLKGEALANG